MIRYYDSATNCTLTDREILSGNDLKRKVDVDQELREITQSMNKNERYMITIARKAYVSIPHCQIRIWRKFPFSFESHHVDSMGIERNMFASIIIKPGYGEKAHEEAIQKVVKTL